MLAYIADIVSDIFSIESCILRTEKAIGNVGLEKSQQKVLLTEVFTQEAFNRIEAIAKESLVALEEGDTLRTMLSILKKLTRHTPVNVVAKKREIAAKIIEAEKYVV